MFLMYVSTKLFKTVQFLYDHDWKIIKSGSEFTLEDSKVYSYQDNSKRPKIILKIGQRTLKPCAIGIL